MHSSVAQLSHEVRPPPWETARFDNAQGKLLLKPGFNLLAQPSQIIQLLRDGDFRVFPDHHAGEIRNVGPYV